MVRRAIAGWLLFTALGACAADATTVVRGEVSCTTTGIARLSECETGRILQLGVMASTRYFIFTRRCEEVSGGGKTPVVLEVEGVITRSSSSANELTIQYPRVINLTAGTCDKALSHSAFDGGLVDRRRTP